MWDLFDLWVQADCCIQAGSTAGGWCWPDWSLQAAVHPRGTGDRGSNHSGWSSAWQISILGLSSCLSESPLQRNKQQGFVKTRLMFAL